MQEQVITHKASILIKIDELISKSEIMDISLSDNKLSYTGAIIMRNEATLYIQMPTDCFLFKSISKERNITMICNSINETIFFCLDNINRVNINNQDYFALPIPKEISIQQRREWRRVSVPRPFPVYLDSPFNQESTPLPVVDISLSGVGIIDYHRKFNVDYKLTRKGNLIIDNTNLDINFKVVNATEISISEHHSAIRIGCELKRSDFTIERSIQELINRIDMHTFRIKKNH